MKTTSDKEVFEKIDSSVNQMDALRNSGLTDFEETQTVKNEISMRESKRLSEKYGASHPRVVALNTRNANYNNMATGLEAEKEKAAIKTEPFEGTSWRLHGRVFDEKLQPIEDLTVYFSDAKRQWIEQLGSYCTDKAGYFTLTLTSELIDKLKETMIFTSVSDKNKKVLCVAKNPAVITKGKIDYIEIFIKDGGCVDPPTRGEKNPFDKNPTDKSPTEPIVGKPTEGGPAKPTDPFVGNPSTKPTEPAGGNPTTKPSEGGATKPVEPIIGKKEEIKEKNENKNPRPK